MEATDGKERIWFKILYEQEYQFIAGKQSNREESLD